MKIQLITVTVFMLLGAWGSVVISGDMMMDKKMEMKKDAMTSMQDGNMENDKKGMSESMEMDAMKKKDAMVSMKDDEMKKDKMGKSDSMKMDIMKKKEMKKTKMMADESM